MSQNISKKFAEAKSFQKKLPEATYFREKFVESYRVILQAQKIPGGKNFYGKIFLKEKIARKNPGAQEKIPATEILMRKILGVENSTGKNS